MRFIVLPGSQLLRSPMRSAHCSRPLARIAGSAGILALLLCVLLSGCGSSAASSTNTGNNGSGGSGSGSGGSGSGSGSGNGSGSSSSSPVAPLSAGNINLIFVVSEDVAYQGAGDIDPATANLTDQGLQRTLQMATFLQNQVLGSNNVTAIYALEPMTHLQTANHYPDIVPLWTVQQFALLNQFTLSTVAGSYASPYSAYSYPLNVSYASGPLPAGVATPSTYSCAACQGIDFSDQGGDNEALVSGILTANAPGFYVFSAPWETVSTLMTNINNADGYALNLPASYPGPDTVYAISVTPQKNAASLLTYATGVQPSSTYPALPAVVPTTSSCTGQTPFSLTVTAGKGGAKVPAGINSNETLYMVRHAEAHPDNLWDDGNYVGAGQWRALDLPAALQGKITVDQVYAIDPAQVIQGTQNTAGNRDWSYVRAALTVEPYAVANNLPFQLAAGFELFASDGPQQAARFFFTGGALSNHKALVGWEHLAIVNTIAALIASYYPSGGAPAVPSWPGGDYDTVWTVTLDGQGNLTVNNAICEGINSSALPATAPQF